MSWELLALASAALYGLQALLFRRIMLRTDALVFTWAFNALFAVLALPLLLFAPPLPAAPGAWIILGAASVVWSVAGFLWFASHQHTEVSLREPLSQLSLLVVFVLSVLFLKESLTIQKIIGTIAVFAGLLILTWTRSRGSWRGVQYTLLFALFIGVNAVLDKLAVNYFHPFQYAFLVSVLPAAVLTPFALRHAAVRHLWVQKTTIVPTMAVSVAAFLAVLAAFQLAEASNVVPVVELSVLVAVVGGFLLHKERDFVRRMAGALVIRPGIIA